MSSGVKRYSIVEIHAALENTKSGELTYTREQIAGALESFARTRGERKHDPSTESQVAILRVAADRIRKGTLYPFGDR